MESLSKNTREGTETFQRGRAQEKETKRGRQNSTYKKRGMEIEFSYKESPEASPCSPTTPTKKGKK